MKKALVAAAVTVIENGVGGRGLFLPTDIVFVLRVALVKGSLR